MYDSNRDADVDNALAEWDNEHSSEDEPNENIEITNDDSIYDLIVGESMSASVLDKDGRIGVVTKLATNSVAATVIISAFVSAMSQASEKSTNDIILDIVKEIESGLISGSKTMSK